MSGSHVLSVCHTYKLQALLSHLSPAGHHPDVSCCSWMQPVHALRQGWQTSTPSWHPLRLEGRLNHHFFSPPEAPGLCFVHKLLHTSTVPLLLCSIPVS